MAKEKFEENCGEFSQAIREHFTYLFDDYGFSVLFQDEGQGGYRCVVILGTPDCIIRFDSNGSFGLVLGSRDVPIGWSIGAQKDSEKRGIWIGFTLATYYFQELEYPDHDVIQEYLEYWREELQGLSYPEHINKKAQGLSEELKPLMPNIIEFFKGESEKFTMDSYKEYYEDVSRKMNRLFNIPGDRE